MYDHQKGVKHVPPEKGKKEQLEYIFKRRLEKKTRTITRNPR